MIAVLCSQVQAKLLKPRIEGVEVVGDASSIPEGARLVVVLRGPGVPPQAVADAVFQTGGRVPVVVAAGPTDGTGEAFLRAARSVGIPEKCVLTGPATVSQLVRVLEGVDAGSDLPDPPLFELEEGLLDPPLFQDACVWEEPGRTEETPPEPAPWAPPASGVLVPVLGATGGVGRTVVAASLAAVLKRQGAGVVLLDAGRPPCLSHYLRGEGVVEVDGLEAGAVASAVARASGDVVLLDTPPSPPYLPGLLGVAEKAVVVVTPDPLVVEATKAFWPQVAGKAVLVVNRVSPGVRNLRGSFRSAVLEAELPGALGVVDVPETEDVVLAATRGVSPASFDTFGSAAAQVLSLLGV
ncbi:hypothetical protein Adeg_0777 [Ammonifex degensii KC4]|uniref:Uncharacterized protein n=1 Tax=Ammonifex degensii (strain DSM 10501 / KC4) TaxID=429009 RepID=C9RCE3_AMMDK|nr:hypothetical protein [Ammonifex degensii]ACX51920.1 hypothetical protein Adeg_0777 [Ammonifex degensii KC4]